MGLPLREGYSKPFPDGIEGVSELLPLKVVTGVSLPLTTVKHLRGREVQDVVGATGTLSD